MKTIGIIALSGDVNREKTEAAAQNLRNLGFEVRLSEHIFDKNRYLAGSDEDKIKDLHNFFQDPEIDLILCARGGYGAIRLVQGIDYDIIKSNPKPFAGFSDVTALLLMIYKKNGMITYHAPMAQSDFAEISEFTLNNFLNALEGKFQPQKGLKVYRKGRAEGILWGGNLSTLTSLCGLDFLPAQDFLFFAEDLNEPVYKIDKMLTQLFNIEQFRKHCKGLILGDFLGVDNVEWLETLFSEIAQKYELPTVGGFKITHAKEKITLPIGVKASLSKSDLKLL